MSNILIAWELGENWGHLSRDLPAARQLRSAGHKVTFAVADTRMAADILIPEKFTFVQAPFARRPASPGKPLVSHAEILLTVGYNDPQVLRGLVSGWLGIFDLLKPDALLVDYAPTAVLAARIRAIPTVVIGNGFELPPQTHPMPSFRPWESIPLERLAAAENMVLRNINQVLAWSGGKPLPKFGEVFMGQRRLLTTFAELDHFGVRSGEQYVGPIFEFPKAHRVSWQPGYVGKRIFAYIRASAPGVEELLSALRARGADTICAFPGASPELVQRYRSANLRIFPMAVEIEPLLRGADLVISHGSGTAAPALLAGVPLLLLPKWTEQYLAALRVESLGAGLVAQGPAAPQSYPTQIDRLLSEPAYREAAQSFAARHSEYRVEIAAKTVADAVQAAATS